jgi:hypothetical protein
MRLASAGVTADSRLTTPIGPASRATIRTLHIQTGDRPQTHPSRYRRTGPLTIQY